MVTVIETELVSKFIYTTLTGDSTLMALLSRGTGYEGVYDTFVPKDRQALQTFPYIIYQWQGGGGDIMITGATRLMSRGYWTVKTLSDTHSFAALSAIVSRFDALLHAQKTYYAGEGYVVSCVRYKPFRLMTFEDGVILRQLGGIYEINARLSS